MVTKVSIIIPVYNVENYLKKCLDSVISQTLDDIEIICVNDGSKDNSLKILLDYAEKNSNIKIINKENGGLGNTRNIGISCANGEYIGFVDSDDWVSEDMFEKLYDNAKKFDSDIAMSPINIVDENSHTTRYDLPYFTLECFDESFYNRSFNHYDANDFIFRISVTVWNKIYKTSFLSDIGAKFPEGLIFEDNPFFYKVFLNAKRVSLVNEYLYYHRFNREGSIITEKNNKYLDIFKIHEISMNIFKESGFFDYYKINLVKYLINSFLNRYNMVSTDLKQEFFIEIKKFVSNFDLTETELIEVSNSTPIFNIKKSKYFSDFEARNDFDKESKKINREYSIIQKDYSKNLKQLKQENKKIKKLKSSKVWIKYKLNKFVNIFKKL